MARSIRNQSAHASAAPEPNAWFSLRHPAFASGPLWGAHAAPSDATPRSPLNLKREDEILRFALGLFSALVFLEREGWPIRPCPESWLLDEDGLPRLLCPPEKSDSEATCSGHAALLFRLLAGRPAPAAGPWPTLPRRHKSFARWNAWLAAARECGTQDAPSLQELLSSLWDLWASGIPGPELPAAWGVGAVWEAPVSQWPNGYSKFTGKTQRLLEGALAFACGSALGPSLSPVFLGNPPPYPFAALEPLMAALLGGTDAARSWLGSRLAKGIPALSRELARLLKTDCGMGWVLWPGRALDAESRRVLKEAGQSLGKPVVVLHEGSETTAGSLSRIHLLWLPTTGEGWYLEHAEALLGPDAEDLLLALDGLRGAEPRPGSIMVPPTPDALLVPVQEQTGAFREDG